MLNINQFFPENMADPVIQKGLYPFDLHIFLREVRKNEAPIEGFIL
jgi:hypothetical protein